jgi:hypothetical protein
MQLKQFAGSATGSGKSNGRRCETGARTALTPNREAQNQIKPAPILRSFESVNESSLRFGTSLCGTRQVRTE